jgi:hypothetical protein
MQRAFRVVLRPSALLCRGMAVAGGSKRPPPPQPPIQPPVESAKDLKWDAMAREASAHWAGSLTEDEGFGEGWLPNEWDEDDEDWMKTQQKGGKIPGGPGARQVESSLQAERLQGMVRDAAAVAKTIVTRTPSPNGAEPDATFLAVLDKLQAGRADFTTEEQAVVTHLLTMGNAEEPVGEHLKI